MISIFFKHFKNNFIFILYFLIPICLHAQTRVQVTNDTVKVINGELIINNSTKNIQGYLYNMGNGVTQFKLPDAYIDSVWKQGDSLYYRKGGVINLAKLSMTDLADPGSNGISVRTGPNATIARTLTGKPGYIVITNGDGIADNPQINIGDSVATIAGTQTLTGKTISGLNNTITNISNSALAINSFNLYVGKSGTAPNWSASSLSLGGVDTLNLPDAGIGITQGLVNNTNQTFDGIKNFNGNLNALGGFQSSNTSWVVAPSTGTSSALTSLLIGSNTSVGMRRYARCSSPYSVQANNDYAGTIFGTEVVNIAPNGNHSIFATVAINPLSIGSSSGAGTLTNSATLLIKGAATGAINNYSLWSASGNIRFDLGGDANGDLLYRSVNSGGSLARLPIGTPGQYLGVSGGLPAWLNIADNFPIFRTVDASTANNYTLASSDQDKTKTFNSSSIIIVTLPSNATSPIPINTEFELVQTGTGILTIAAGNGATIYSPGNKLKAYQQYSVIKIKKIGTDKWLLSGDLR